MRDLQWVDLAEDWNSGVRRILSVVLPERTAQTEFLSKTAQREIRVVLVADVVAYTAISEMVDESGFFGGLKLMTDLEPVREVNESLESLMIQEATRIT